MSQCILAIDPGASGGLAFRTVSGPILCEPMPKNDENLIAAIGHYAQAFPMGQTLKAYTMFKFGRGFGFLQGVLQSRGWRITLVRPQEWTKELGIGTSVDCISRTEWKNKLKAKAQELFPECHPTLATADALLILQYAINDLQAIGK